jgi:hypothetical protein
MYYALKKPKQNVQVNTASVQSQFSTLESECNEKKHGLSRAKSASSRRQLNTSEHWNKPSHAQLSHGSLCSKMSPTLQNKTVLAQVK